MVDTTLPTGCPGPMMPTSTLVLKVTFGLGGTRRATC